MDINYSLVHIGTQNCCAPKYLAQKSSIMPINRDSHWRKQMALINSKKDMSKMIANDEDGQIFTYNDDFVSLSQSQLDSMLCLSCKMQNKLLQAVLSSPFFFPHNLLHQCAAHLLLNMRQIWCEGEIKVRTL